MTADVAHHLATTLRRVVASASDPRALAIWLQKWLGVSGGAADAVDGAARGSGELHLAWMVRLFHLVWLIVKRSAGGNPRYDRHYKQPDRTPSALAGRVM